MNHIGLLIQEHLTELDTLLDLGSGIMQGSDDLKCKCIIGVDLIDKYLDRIKLLHPTVKADITKLDIFVDDSYDVVLSMDSIEHLKLEDAQKLIVEMKRIARKKVIIYTPNEFKSNEEQVTNSWDLGHNELQRHLCLIDKQYFRNNGFVIRTDNEGIFAIWSK